MRIAKGGTINLSPPPETNLDPKRPTELSGWVGVVGKGQKKNPKKKKKKRKGKGGRKTKHEEEEESTVLVAEN
ncbi:hypothetical protein LX36DRAFT_655570 [Colletotrichum falcatum]|nr:hypothetical protein LX36DRAFT_655570 [Colletotrichum falcatum]